MPEPVLAALIGKLPPLDLTWPQEQQAQWWKWFQFLWQQVPTSVLRDPLPSSRAAR